MGASKWRFQLKDECCSGGPLDCYECTFAVRPRQLVLDLGEGGWTTVECDGCPNIQGQYTVEDFYSACLWQYEENNMCEYNGKFPILRIRFSHNFLPDPGWRWKVVVDLFVIATSLLSTATYYSAITEDEDCWALGGTGPGDKIQLDKFSEEHQGPIFLCADTLPDIIHVWLP